MSAKTLNSRPTHHLPFSTIGGSSSGVSSTASGACDEKNDSSTSLSLILPSHAALSGQIAQTAQSYFLARDKWLAVSHADCPAPITSTIFHVIQQGRRRGRPAID